MSQSSSLFPISRRVETARAFTLIELLTVIAIIGILAAIIIPTVGKVRETAKAARCLSNVREISRALFMYADDNKGALPHPSLAGQFGPGVGQAWWFGIDRYFQNASNPTLTRTQDISRCPSDDTAPSGTGITWSYAMNQNLAKTPAGTYAAAGQLPVNLRNLRGELGRMVMVAEMGGIAGTASIGALSPTPGTGVGQNSGFVRHSSRANYGFLDGSVKTLRQTEAYDAAATPPVNLWSIQ